MTTYEEWRVTGTPGHRPEGHPVKLSPFRVLVTGSRDVTPDQVLYIERRLRSNCRNAVGTGRPVIIVQGECPRGGVDLVAKRWALRTEGVENESHPAQWDKFGKAAGMLRNKEMVDTGARICLAFPSLSSVGTWDCVRKAANAGIITYIYPLEGV